MNSVPKIIVIEGTNASGKSALGIELAQKYNGEIISADSRQIFRGFDLCCGKVTADEMQGVKHHLINICDIGDEFSVSDYQARVYEVIPKILSRGKTPFIVGGTGLYLSSVVYGFDFPDENFDKMYRAYLDEKSIVDLQNLLPVNIRLSLNESDYNNKRRLIRILEKIRYGKEDITPHNKPLFNSLQIGVTWPKDLLYKRIEERLSLRIKQGMIDEVKDYLNAGGNPDVLYDLGLEYKYIALYVQGQYASVADFYVAMAHAIKKFAKRQLTWFHRDKYIHWIDMTGNYWDCACQLIDNFLKE